MTRAGVSDAVVSTQVLLGRRHLGANPIARHAVRVVCLVHDACGAAGAQDVAARFWKDKGSRFKKKKDSRENDLIPGFQQLVVSR